MRIKYVEIRNFRGIKSLSWHVKGKFNCLIGPGDTCKSTILTAIEFALSPRTSLFFDDSDFYDQDTDQQIVIQVTLGDWDESLSSMRLFFQEKNFGQYKCGLAASGPVPEPSSDSDLAISVSLRVDKSLEPKWAAVKGRDELDVSDRKTMHASDRALLGSSRLDIFSDFQFTWGRNTILTRLGTNIASNINAVLSELVREMRQIDISSKTSISECQTIADAIKEDARNVGVVLADLSPKIDIQRQSTGAGALSLHEGNVPLRNKGSGSKRLIGAAMQMKLHGGKNISVIDELEIGLEPHRIRGLIHKLRNSPQQVFTTTHSPVVIRELEVSEHEIYYCKRDDGAAVTLQSLGTIPDIQGSVRRSAEAFLGSRIIACEGLTEIGCLRAYDNYRYDEHDPPVWSLATSYFDCNGAGRIKTVCSQVNRLGYVTGVLCDNDAPDQLSPADIEDLRATGIHVCQWDVGNATEHQLFLEIPWSDVPALLEQISRHHHPDRLRTMIDCIRNEPRISELELSSDPADWADCRLIRKVLGDVAHHQKWIKRISSAEAVFRFSLPRLPSTSVLMSRLDTLWRWIQDE